MSEFIWNDEREARHEFGDSDLTPDQKAAIVARAMAEFDKLDPVKMEEEWREILELHEKGLTIPFEDVLAQHGIEVDDQLPDHEEAG